MIFFATKGKIIETPVFLTDKGGKRGRTPSLRLLGGVFVGVGGAERAVASSRFETALGSLRVFLSSSAVKPPSFAERRRAAEKKFRDAASGLLLRRRPSRRSEI